MITTIIIIIPSLFSSLRLTFLPHLYLYIYICYYILQRVALAAGSSMSSTQAEYMQSLHSEDSAKESTNAANPDSHESRSEIDKSEDDRQRHSRWAAMYPYYPHLKSICSKVSQWLAVNKAFTLRWKFTSIKKFLIRAYWVLSPWFPSLTSWIAMVRRPDWDEFLTQPNQVKQWVTRFQQMFHDEFGALFRKIRVALQVSFA